MSNEKVYLLKTAELISDSKAENNLGVMCANTKAGKKVYVSKVDAKNAQKEVNFVKQNVCNYCHDVFEFNANMSKDKVAEFYTNSADYYSYALQNDIPAQEIYAVSKEINQASANLTNSYVNTEQEDLELNK